ncbi:MAG: DEAD/DEAH box helicase family protein [Eubacteriales bacterium]
MGVFNEQIKFIYDWRPYQKHVLDELAKHMNDEHLHVVAPPGSGKTVLGLEVVRQISQPTLIFAPTITIRNQWVQRFVELFCPDGLDTSFISSDLRELKLLNVSTYQSLHSLLDNEEKQSVILDTFTKAGIKVLLVDEAHHLRTEWWKSLIMLKEHLQNVKMIALTATPPYDTDGGEWKKYIELCGEIDAEIYVPELVANKNLCPHQDYIYLSTPTRKERLKVVELSNKIKAWVEGLHDNKDFIEAIKEHKHLNNAKEYEENILDDPEYYVSLLAFLIESGQKFELHYKMLLRTIGIKKKQIPKLDSDLLTKMLEKMLYKDNESYPDIIIKELKKEMKSIGMLTRKKISFELPKSIQRTLLESKSKLLSMKEIVKLEYSHLKDGLRMVILTDYIRKEERYHKDEEVDKINKIGVVPIFDYLRLTVDEPLNFGILCGTYVVIPAKKKKLMLNIALEKGIENNYFYIKNMTEAANYIEVSIKGSKSNKIVDIITELFKQGGINVLIGTQALLGEGWDAPCINSLILGTFVGSFMLSNQMRGRAIRVDGDNPKKTSNIWHLVCLINNKDDDIAPYTEQIDLQRIERRSEAYVGLSHIDLVIENGINRFGSELMSLDVEKVKTFNNNMIDSALNRNALSKQWEEAIFKKEDMYMIEEMAVEEEMLPAKYINKINLKKIIIKSTFIGVILLLNYFMFKELKLVQYINYGLILIFGLPKIFKNLKYLLKHINANKSMETIAKVVLNSLIASNVINSRKNKLQLNSGIRNNQAYVSLKAEDHYDEQVFLEAMSELMEPIDNPRYVLIDKKISGIVDYLQVPSKIGKNRNNVDYFKKLWRQNISNKVDVVYTRTKNGRKLLLKARTKSLANVSLKRIERKKVWQ